jgi:hypothetical protein
MPGLAEAEAIVLFGEEEAIDREQAVDGAVEDEDFGGCQIERSAFVRRRLCFIHQHFNQKRYTKIGKRLSRKTTPMAYAGGSISVSRNLDISSSSSSGAAMNVKSKPRKKVFLSRENRS